MVKMFNDDENINEIEKVLEHILKEELSVI